MKVLVINGSPAGPDSITLQTVHYLENYYGIGPFDVIDAGRKSKSLEKDFSEAKRALEKADLLLFCYPVYTFLVPSQLHRFIELMKENGAEVKGKYATQITTSLHFYDITAHRFIEDNCADLGLRYIRGLSADMEDLLSEKGQLEARNFLRYVVFCMKNNQFERPSAAPASAKKKRKTASVPKGEKSADSGYRIAVVADLDPQEPDPSLDAMIRRFVKVMNADCEIINIREFPFAGGCLGCFKCASDGKCFYRDGFDTFLRENINGADAVVYAFSIRDHSMGYRFKLFDDRQFCNGHRTVTMGKPVGYLVSGDLSREENLRILMEARSEVGGNFFAGIASDEKKPDTEITNLARTLEFAFRTNYQPPKNFYGVGGMKIFRDLIYQMRGLMKEDHRFYKEHGFYDFPQKRQGRVVLMYLVSALMKNKKLMQKSGMTMTEGMLMPYRKVLEKAKKRND